MKLRVNGSDISDLIDVAIKSPESDLGITIGTARFDIYDDERTLATVPRNGDLIEILDDTLTQLLFGGHLTQVEREPLIAGRLYHCTAEDWNYLLDELYVDPGSSSGGVTDGWLAWFIVDFWCDGIVTNPVFDSIISVTGNISPQTWQRMTVRALLNQISTLVGGVVFFLDAAKQFHWNDVGRLAPYAVSTSPNEQQSTHRTYREEVIADAPVGYWRLGDKGATAKDSSGNGRDGTYTGGVTLGAAGAVDDNDAAATFDGVSGECSVADAAALRLNGAWSVEAWAYLKSYINLYPGIMNKGTSGLIGDGWLIFAPQVQPGQLIWKRDNNQQVITAAGFTALTWHHIVVTYDGSTTLLAYLDNLLTLTAPGIAYVANTDVSSLLIGHGDPNQFMNAVIDEVAIYPAALSAARIAAHYAAGKVRLASMGGLKDFRDTTRAVEQVYVIGNAGLNVTATDWVEHARSDIVRGYENSSAVIGGTGATASTRFRRKEITDTTLDTTARVQQRAYRELLRPRTIRFTTWRSGLQAGQLIDVVSEQWKGADVAPLPRPAMRWKGAGSRSGGLQGSLGRFLIQKVTPKVVAAGLTEYSVMCGTYESDLPSLLVAKL